MERESKFRNEKYGHGSLRINGKKNFLKRKIGIFRVSSPTVNIIFGGSIKSPLEMEGDLISNPLRFKFSIFIQKI